MPPYTIPLFAQQPNAQPPAPMVQAMASRNPGAWPASIEASYARDPRGSMVEAMMRQSLDTSPTTLAGGIGRMGSALFAGLANRSLRKEYGTKADTYRQQLEAALAGLPGDNSDLRRLAQIDPEAAMRAAFARANEKPSMVQAIVGGVPRYVPESEAAGLQSDFPPQSKAPDMRTRTEGDREITEQWNAATGRWEKIGEAPRWAPKTPDKPKLVQIIRNGVPVWVSEDEATGQQADYPPQTGQITPAQSASNAEIAAARKRLDALGLDPDKLLSGMQKTSDTGLDNPSYSPNLSHDVSLAMQHMVGDDPGFADYQNLFTAGASPGPMGGGASDPALAGGVPSPSAGTPMPIPAGAIDMLRTNPSLAAMFDQKYGPGASSRYLIGGQ